MDGWVKEGNKEGSREEKKEEWEKRGKGEKQGKYLRSFKLQNISSNMPSNLQKIFH